MLLVYEFFCFERILSFDYIFDVIELKNRILVEQINIMQAYVGNTWPTSPDPGSTKQLRQRHATQTIVVEEPPSAVFIVETLEIPGGIFR